VSNQIERLRYYDGEYLSGHDFGDEQAYHIEMRRRLNHRLHLHGIVYGLHLVVDQDSPPFPAVPFFSIEQGMAIDRSGREIYLPAPYSLSTENVLNGPGLDGGDYEIWLCYQELQTGLPAAGYRDCNATNQQTRYQEYFQVVLNPRQPKKTSYIPPDCGGVRLGMVSISGKQIIAVNEFADSKPLRTYVGIRAQRVIAADEEAESYDISAASPTAVPDQLLPGYLDVQPSVFNRGNVFVKKNLVVGDDFLFDPSKLNPTTTDLTQGNLKITSDLFLNGNFYGRIGKDWLGLKQYIQSLMPETVIGTSPVPIPQSTVTTGNVDVPVHTRLPTVSTKKVVLSISEIEWRDAAELPNFKGPMTVTVEPTMSDKGGGDFNLSIQWTVAPTANFGGGDNLPIKHLVVSYVVVFNP
jgi:hypothetical protein